MDTTSTFPTLPARTAGSDERCCGGPVATPNLDAGQTLALAERLKALADPTRLRMLDLLDQQEQPLCVCDITAEFEQHQPTISHHLRVLRRAGLIGGTKRGVWSYYWVTEEGRRIVSVVKALL